VTIARHKAIDSLRASVRRALPVEHLPESPGPTGLDLAVRMDLVVALAGLPTRQRQAVAYHHLAGFPYAQVAALLGGSEAAARRAAADGMRSLRQVMVYGQHEQEEGAR
jgi:DNA-directed RNA polymerase specialized sigma24 family protein